MSKYELVYPPVRTWPGLARRNYGMLYRKTFLENWVGRLFASLMYLPGSPFDQACKDLKRALEDTSCSRE